MGFFTRLFKGADKDVAVTPTGAGQQVGGERDYDRGIRLFDAGNYGEAIEALTNVLENRRTGPLVERLARFYLAESYSAAALAQLRTPTGDPQEAVKQLRTAIGLNPSFADLHFRLGSTLLHHGDTEEAIRALRRAVEINPRYTQALLHLAVALLRSPRGDMGEAFGFARRAGELGFASGKPEFDTVQAAMTRGDREKAAELLAHLMESPEDDQTLMLAANALNLFGQGRFAEAEATYRSALERKPRYADLRNQLGVTLFAQNRDAEALQEFDSAIAINDRYAEAHLNRGFALLRMEREDEGLIAIRVAMELDPDNSVMMVRMKKMFPGIEGAETEE